MKEDIFTLDTIGILLIVLIFLVLFLSPLSYAIVKRIIKFFKSLSYIAVSDEEKDLIILSIKESLKDLVKSKKGASIIIDIKDETHEYTNNSQKIDAVISSSLLTTFFKGNKTPLHDGAVIIKGNRIDCAAAYINNLSDQSLPEKFGTRHRSALGLSEVTKAIIIVLSEEDGKIRIFQENKWENVSQKDFYSKMLEIWV